MNKKFFFISGTLISGWIIIEYIANSNIKKNLRKQLKKFLQDGKNHLHFYSRDDDNFLEKELSKVESSEKIHMLFSFKNTFKFSNDDIKCVLNRVNSYKNLRDTIRSDKLLNYTEWNMLWFPYFLRVLFSCLNNIFLLKYYSNIKLYNSRKTKIYKISNINNTKNLVIFLGLGGIILPFNKIIDFFLSKGYNIIIPLYGPSQASLKYDLDINEFSFYKNINYFLLNEGINSFSILSHSLGGILYKGYHNYLHKYDRKMIIDCVYLFEPLICIRACMDTFFSHRRHFIDTIKIMDSVTSDKYSFYNIVFSYFLHTIVGFGTAHSLGYFTNVETKNSEKVNYPRYLFISSDDLIINNILDKQYIKNNYVNDNVFFRKGYHGGWPNSSKLLPILVQIVK